MGTLVHCLAQSSKTYLFDNPPTIINQRMMMATNLTESPAATKFTRYEFLGYAPSWLYR